MGGQGGVCIFLKIDRATEIIFGKLLGEIEFEFLRNLKFEFEFEDELESEKKARRGRGLALNPRLDPLIPRSSNSLGLEKPATPLQNGSTMTTFSASLGDSLCLNLKQSGKNSGIE